MNNKCGLDFGHRQCRIIQSHLPNLAKNIDNYFAIPINFVSLSDQRNKQNNLDLNLE